MSYGKPAILFHTVMLALSSFISAGAVSEEPRGVQAQAPHAILTADTQSAQLQSSPVPTPGAEPPASPPKDKQANATEENPKKQMRYSAKTIEVVRRTAGYASDFHPIYEELGPEATVELHQMLGDADWTENWGDIAQIIAHISNDPDTSVEVICDYIARVEDKSTLGKQADSIVGGKLIAISALGWLGGEKADRELRHLFSGEGAEKTLRIWRSYVPEDEWPKSITAEWIVGAASRGLVFSSSPTNIALVEAEYRRIDTLIRQRPKAFWRSSIMTLQDSQIESMYGDLVISLAIRDTMATVGRETYRHLDGIKQSVLDAGYFCKYDYLDPTCE